MKELLQQYTAYNVWATQKLINLITELPADKPFTELESSFSSLYKTLLHMWDAESIWWQRLKMQERIFIPSENDPGILKDVCVGLMQQSKQFEHWVHTATDRSLEHVFQYYNRKNEHFKMPVYQLILHVVNHATYHRGQLISLLHQLGIKKLPSTDFSSFVLDKNKK